MVKDQPRTYSSRRSRARDRFADEGLLAGRVIADVEAHDGVEAVRAACGDVVHRTGAAPRPVPTSALLGAVRQADCVECR
jgi:hypothetical protein